LTGKNSDFLCCPTTTILIVTLIRNIISNKRFACTEDNRVAMQKAFHE